MTVVATALVRRHGTFLHSNERWNMRLEAHCQAPTRASATSRRGYPPSWSKTKAKPGWRAKGRRPRPIHAGASAGRRLPCVGRDPLLVGVALQAGRRADTVESFSSSNSASFEDADFFPRSAAPIAGAEMDLRALGTWLKRLQVDGPWAASEGIRTSDRARNPPRPVHGTLRHNE